MDVSKFKSIGQADVANKRVLVRADLNVPVQDGQVADATRLARLAPGLKALMDRGAKVIVMSHFGRPKHGPDPALSLKPVAARLAGLLGVPLAFVDNCIGGKAEQAAASISPGQVLVLENLRFHKGEEANDPAFIEALARLGDIYVNDAFSTAHRAHASTEGLAHHLPAYAGPLMLEEIGALTGALENPRRPVAAVIGGAKVSTKIPVLENLLVRVDKLIIGGGMANTFYQAQGVDVGRSLAEPDFHETARRIMHEAKARGCEVVLPADVVVADKLGADASSSYVDVLDVPKDAMILDIGPKAVAHYADVLSRCQTLLWNGPLGAFEVAPFGEGTFTLARAAAELTKAGRLVSIAGGGDTVAALNAAGVAEDFTYVSTAGGAFLEWLEGRSLPGVAALCRA